MLLWVTGIPLWIQGHRVEESVKSADNFQGTKYVLQFDGPIKAEWKTSLEAYGVRFYDYIPMYAFIVKIPGDKAMEKVRSFPHFHRLVPFETRYKLPPDYQSRLNTCYEKEGDLYRVRILVFEPEDLDTIAELLRKQGYTVEGITRKYAMFVQAILPLNEIEKLTDMDMVKFIEFRYPIVNWNDENAVLHQSGIFDSLSGDGGTDPTDTIVWMKGIRGEGEILGHNDDELEATNCFFDGTVDGNNKIVDLCDYDNGGCGQSSLALATGHGTHTAGTAVGGVDEGTNGSIYKGMAYKARLVSQVPLGGGNTESYETVLQDAYDRGARVHTNSWGQTCRIGNNSYCAPSNYNTESQIIDNFTYTNPDMLVVFAAGNHGDQSCISGCYRSSSDPATAKNDITVAAMERTTDAKASWSAYGLYPSGRFGNDVIAHGVYTRSACSAGLSSTCGSGCYIASMSGTSMATPAVAGMALLMRQYYREGWYGDGTEGSATGIDSPSAALLKASILASAIPITQDGDDLSDNPVPNGNEGAGRPVLDNVMYFSPEDEWNTLADSSDERKSRLWFVDAGSVSGLSTDQTDEYKIYIGNPHMVTRIVLTWIDTTGAEYCATDSLCLVNDLDLIVVDSTTGDVYYGNATTTGVDNLTPANTFNDDDLNTWEIVRLSGVTGTFYIRVYAEQVTTSNPQTYALVVSGGLGEAPTPITTPEIKQDFRLRHLWGKKLVLTTPYNRDLTIHIYSISGRKVFSYTPSTINSGQVILDLNHLPSGTYMMKVLHQGREAFSRKIILN